MPDFDVAAAGQQAAMARLLTYGEAGGVEVRRGDGWAAVRTGIDNNDLNGVCSEPDAVVSRDLVNDLLGWLEGVPACWQTREPTPRLTAVLTEAGARSETSGHWSGLAMALLPGGSGGVDCRLVEDGADFEAWLDVAQACGWIETGDDREVRRRVCLGLGLHHPRLRWWVADVDGQAVGFASAYLDGDVVDLSDLGVAPGTRRRGVGRSLTAARLAWARGHGATRVVSAPSPDGWQLQRTLGLTLTSVLADTCFYLPTG